MICLSNELERFLVGYSFTALFHLYRRQSDPEMAYYSFLSNVIHPGT
jgi:hypothetical protein